MLKPIGAYIVIESYKRSTEEQKVGGIIIPGTSEDPTEKVLRGKVVAVGDGVDMPWGRVPLRVKPGDNVVLNKYVDDDNATTIKYDGKTYIIVREVDIYGISDE